MIRSFGRARMRGTCTLAERATTVERVTGWSRRVSHLEEHPLETPTTATHNAYDALGSSASRAMQAGHGLLSITAA